MKIIAENLYFLRKKNNINAKVLAKIINTNVDQIYRWERNDSVPNAYQFLAICLYFNVSAESFVTKKLDPNIDEEKRNHLNHIRIDKKIKYATISSALAIPEDEIIQYFEGQNPLNINHLHRLHHFLTSNF